ncbi:MAG: hypothetical protein QXP71_03200 [Desulfurococcaceae archaeon]
MNLSRVNNLFVKILKYREGLLIYVFVNIYLLSIIPFSWLYYDVRYYYEWVDIAWSSGFAIHIWKIPGYGLTTIVFPKGLLYIYMNATKASYPPLPILLFITTHSIVSSFTNSLQLIRLIDKLPLVIVFNIVYFVLKKNYGWKTSLLWILNGFTYLTIHTYHTDLFISLFLLMSFIEFFRRNNVVKSSIYLALASLFKPIVLILAFVLLIIMFKRRMFREIVLFTLCGLITGLIVILPFLLVDYRSFMYKALFFHMDRFPQEYSLWAIPIYLYNYDFSKIPDIIKYLWFPTYLSALIYLFSRLIRERDLSEKNIVNYYLLTLLFTYLLNKIGNLNYFVWCVPFLAIYVVENKFYTNHRFILLYLFIPLILVVIAPFTTFYSAFIVHGSVFIIEDLSYYSATELTIKSIDPSTIQIIIADYLRTNVYWYFLLLYMGINVSYIVFSAIYNSYLIYLIITVFKK